MWVNLALSATGWLLGWISIALAPGRMLPRSRLGIPKSGDRRRSSQENGLGDETRIVRRVAVLIPARDEAARLSHLLSCCIGLPPQWEVLVADDNSTDGTADVAHEFGVKVVQVPPLPEGWLGKPWACWNAVLSTDADLLVFLDSDVEFDADVLVSMAESLGDGRALTVQPWHWAPTFSEEFSSWFNLMVWLGTRSIATSNHGGFGPCLFVSRVDYLRVGGHQVVAREVLENHHLTSVLAASGIRVEQMVGTDSLRFRMYSGGWSEVVRGWSKHFVLGARETPSLKLVVLVVWIAGAGAGFTQWLKTLVWLSGPRSSFIPFEMATVILISYITQLRVALRCVGSFRWYTAVAYPLYLVSFLLIVVRTLLLGQRVQVWKGRFVGSDARGGRR